VPLGTRGADYWMRVVFLDLDKTGDKQEAAGIAAGHDVEVVGLVDIW
jgi:hypothetical protein